MVAELLMIKMSDWSTLFWKITLTMKWWETVVSSVKVVFITVLRQEISSLTLITFNHCLSILLLKLSDFMKMLKSQTLKMKLVFFLKRFNQFNQEPHHQQAKVVKKLLRKLPFLFKKELLNHGLWKIFTKSIQLFMKKVWTLFWFKNLSDTTNFFNWWLRHWRTLRKPSKV